MLQTAIATSLCITFFHTLFDWPLLLLLFKQQAGLGCTKQSIAQYMWFDGSLAYSKLPIEDMLSEIAIAKFKDGSGYVIMRW